MIDWEKPSIEENETVFASNDEGKDPLLADDENNKEFTIKQPRVVAWRSIFVANEFNEIQSEFRYISPETTMIWLCFLLRGVKLENWAASDPDMTKNPSDNTPKNYILLFFIVATLYLCIGATQYAIRGIKKNVSFPAEY